MKKVKDKLDEKLNSSFENWFREYGKELLSDGKTNAAHLLLLKKVCRQAYTAGYAEKEKTC